MLLEALAAIAIVGLAIIASTGFMMRRAAIIDSVEQRAVTDQALASEMDMLLADVPTSLVLGERPWRSGALLSPVFSDARPGMVRVTRAEQGLLRVRVELRWNDGRVIARERLVAAP